MNVVRIMVLSSILLAGSACFADVQSTAAKQDDVIDFNIDDIDEKDLKDFQVAHNITYEEPSWPVLKLQEFAAWLIVTFPSILTVAARAYDYKEALDAWWEAHRAPLQKAYCATYADYCKLRSPNICELHQFLIMEWLRTRVLGTQQQPVGTQVAPKKQADFDDADRALLHDFLEHDQHAAELRK